MPDPSIPPLAREALADDLQSLHALAQARTGDSTIIGVMGHQPDILRWYFDEFYGRIFYNAHPGMRVDVRSKELMRVKLSKQHGCQFCNRFNTVEALERGVTQEQIDAIYDIEAPCWDDRDRALLRLAEEMMLQNDHGQLTTELRAELNRFYDDGQIIELGFVAAVLTGVAKWIFTYDMVNREEICPIRPPLAVAAE